MDYDESKNEYTFHYVYNEDFYYRIEYYRVNPDGSMPTFIESEPADPAGQESGWTTTENHSYIHQFDPEQNKYSGQNLKLYSAQTMTTTLRSDAQQDEDDPGIHPKQNIIKVYYAPDKNVNFTYNTLTYDNWTDKHILSNNGGHVDPTSQTGVNPFSGVGRSTGFTHPGFKFYGWFKSTTNAEGEIVLGTQITETVKVEGDTATLEVPKPYYIYTADEQYTAVYIYDTTPFDITYETSIKSAIGETVTDGNVQLQYGTDDPTASKITKTLTNAILPLSDVKIAKRVSYYPYVNWTNAAGTILPATTDGTFTTPTTFFNDGTDDGYYYYQPGSYICNFNESQYGQFDLTYMVDNSEEGIEEYGNIRLNKSGAEAKKSDKESVWPLIGNGEIGTTQTPKVYSATAVAASEAYEFKNWTAQVYDSESSSWVDVESWVCENANLNQ